MNLEQELNVNQLEAVTAEDQYLRIVAGAGSGKTRVLTYRIAYLIESLGVLPNRILAITFTNKVAREMNERAKKLLPDYNLSGLTISTFHSWCARFLRCEIDYLGFSKNFLIYDDEDQERLVKAIGIDFGYKKSDDHNKAALDFICRNKMKGKLPSDVSVEKGSEFQKVLKDYFIEYEKRKSEANALDFDDLLIYSIKILEDCDEIRNKYAKRYEHILIDEFQDTNDVQFRLLTLLTNGLNSIFVVGDPDQTIYTRRGANQRVILDFDKIFQPTRSIVLNENYRSTPQILEAANNLISNNKKRIKKDLFTNNYSKEEVSLNVFDNSQKEATFIANKIIDLKKHDDTLEYKDFAVLYRSSYLSVKIENALVTRGIPYRVYGGIKFYARREIKDCLAYFHLLVNKRDDVSFERIINVPKRSIGDISFATLREEAKSANLSMMEYLDEIEKHNSELRPFVIQKLIQMRDLMNETSQKLFLNAEAYSEVLDDFLKKVGYYEHLSYLTEEEDEDRAENVHALIDDIRSYLTNHIDSNFEEYLQNVALLSAQDEIDGSDSVNLMTAHTSKGLEFKYVFIIGFSQGQFPNYRALEEGTEERIEEERRLAYVGMTRAKIKLFITYNYEYNYASQSSGQPSQFIQEARIKKNNSLTISSKDSNGFNIYRYDMNKNNYGNGERGGYKNADSKSFVNVMKKNNIEWAIGDICHHTIFGDGVVTEIEGDIVTIDFENFGKKKILGSHHTLTKKEKVWHI